MCQEYLLARRKIVTSYTKGPLQGGIDEQAVLNLGCFLPTRSDQSHTITHHTSLALLLTNGTTKEMDNVTSLYKTKETLAHREAHSEAHHAAHLGFSTYSCGNAGRPTVSPHFCHERERELSLGEVSTNTV